MTTPVLAHPEHMWLMAAVVFSFLSAAYLLLARASRNGWLKRQVLASGLILGALYGVVPRLLRILGSEAFLADLAVPLVLFGLPFLLLFFLGTQLLPGTWFGRLPKGRKMGAVMTLGFALGAWAAFVGSLALLPAASSTS